MKKEEIDLALAELEELGSIEMYESAIRMIEDDHVDDISIYWDNICGHRTDTLHILIKAKKLSDEQLLRIAVVDRFLLINRVPHQFDELQKWLRRNALRVDYDGETQLSTIKARPIFISRNSAREIYTKKQIEYFKCRTETYLSIWENATIEELKVYDWKNCRSIGIARMALQRVFWGNHLSEGQIIRLVHTDLKWYLHAEFESIDSIYLKPIKKLLEHFDIYHYYTEQNSYSEDQEELNENELKETLNYWDWVSETWEDEETGWEETKDALEHRWTLHCAYKQGLLNPQAIKELIELDKAAMLSPNFRLFSRFERKIISDFLLAEGAFDPLPQEPNEAVVKMYQLLGLLQE